MGKNINFPDLKIHCQTLRKLGILLRFFRYPNLIIVAFTQILLHYFIILPHFKTAQQSPTFSGFSFFILIVISLTVTAGGYVINDIVDYPIDVINKPEKTIVNIHLSVAQAKWIYTILVAFGFVLSLAFSTTNFHLIWGYLLAVALLWCYAYYFKQGLLIGNFVVAFFCALVASVLVIVEKDSLLQLQLNHPNLAEKMLWMIGIYSLFAFISTLYREVIKDMEDIEGDRLHNCQTLPIVLGIKGAKIYTWVLGAIFLIFLNFLVYWLWLNQYFVASIFSIWAIVMPLIVSLFLLKDASTQQQFKTLSHLAKWKMLAGLLLLLGL